MNFQFINSVSNRTIISQISVLNTIETTLYQRSYFAIP